MRVTASAEVHADLAVLAHREAVDACLHTAVDGGVLGWERALAASEGADPRLVAHRAHALGLHVEGWTSGAEPEPHDPWTPELHARDYEWYFTPTCAAHLATRAAGYGQSMLCLGAPTVAFALLDRPELRRVTLVDRNPLALRRHRGGAPLHAICEELAAARLEAGAYDAVVFDAPWYPDELRRWLAVAAAAVRPRGRVLFALMQPLHRPSAADDRAAILAHARRLGEVTVEPARLRYHSPRFEREALAAAGLHVPLAWRRADLVELVVRASREAPAPSPTHEPAWTRFVVGSQVIQLDPRAQHDPRVQPHVHDEPGDVLSPVGDRDDFRYASISTRDPRRSEIGLWTSRSRVARVRRPELVAALLERLAHDGEHRGLQTAPELRELPDRARARLLDALDVIVGSPCSW